jgi:hypothetical protein
VAVQPPSIRIGVYGSDDVSPRERHGCGLWMAGFAASLAAVNATAVPLAPRGRRPWSELVAGLDGIVLGATDHSPAGALDDAEALCHFCKANERPILAIDHGMLVLNGVFGGTTHLDVARELPDALQHRHPPEKGLRHAILVERGTLLADIYGEGEVVVSSEHRRAINRVGRGFRVGARALDGVIESIEADSDHWFALGVQWHPASSTSSGLDIQLFRGLVEFCQARASFTESACIAA